MKSEGNLVRIQGGPPPPYFYSKLRPEGPKIFFGDRAPSLSQGMDPVLILDLVRSAVYREQQQN